MTMEQKMLCYYFDSKPFSDAKNSFFAAFDHRIGERSEFFEWEPFLWNVEDELTGVLSDEDIQKYFTGDYADEQVFAIAYGAWWKLTKSQLAQIADRQNRAVCWRYLDFFIHHRELETPPEEYLPFITGLDPHNKDGKIPWQK